MSEQKSEREFLPVNIAVLTVSDTRTLDDDKSGDTLVDRIAGAGHELAAREIVPDDRCISVARPMPSASSRLTQSSANMRVE